MQNHNKELPVKNTSDGLYVTYRGTSKQGWPMFTFTVNNPAQQAPALLTLNVAGKTIYYAEGETWQQAIDNHKTENASWSYDSAWGEVHYSSNDMLYYYVPDDDNTRVDPDDVINPGTNYTF